MNRRLFEKRFGFFALVLFGTVNISLGCAVPVFRYALERWVTDPYIVTVNRGDNLSEDAAKACELLESFSSWDNEAVANVVVRDYKLKDKVELAAGQMAVHFPYASHIEKPILVGEISEKAVKEIVNSPIRAEIAKRLVEGDSAVWVFLEGPDAEKNEAAFELIEKKLKELEENLMLPEDELAAETGVVIAEEDEHAVGISFSMLKLARDNEDEKFLIDLLLDTEGDLREYDEPLVFPVFGRGIILFALVGDGINAENIEEACLFLTGPCSCQVKALNPGLDMLIKFNWDKTLAESLIVKQIELPELEGLGEMVKAEAGGDTAKPEIIPAADLEILKEDGTEGTNNNRLLRNVVGLLAIFMVIVIGGTWVLGKRKR